MHLLRLCTKDRSLQIYLSFENQKLLPELCSLNLWNLCCKIGGKFGFHNHRFNICVPSQNVSDCKGLEERTKGKLNSNFHRSLRNTCNDKNYFSVIFNHPVTLTFLFQTSANRQRKKDRKFLKVHWSDFHLSSLGRILISFPVPPVDPISVRWVLSMMIQTVQVGRMTMFVPPGSLKWHSAVTVPAVIVLIFGWKGMTTLVRKWITSSSWTKNTCNVIE